MVLQQQIPPGVIGIDAIDFQFPVPGPLPEADLAISKSDAADPIVAGNQLTLGNSAKWSSAAANIGASVVGRYAP